MSGWAAAGMAIGQAAADIIGGWSSGEQARRTSERMYTHRYQWQMNDLRKAGLNPMLAFGQAPPVPSNPQTPDYSNLGSRAGAAYLTAKQANANIELTRAQTAATMAAGAKTETETAILQLSPQYDENNRAAMQEMFLANVEKAKLEWRVVEQDLKGKKLQYATDEELFPLAIQAAKYANEMARLQIPEAKAMAAFWDAAGVPAVIAEKITKLIPRINLGGIAEKVIGSAKGAFKGRVPFPRRTQYR